MIGYSAIIDIYDLSLLYISLMLSTVGGLLGSNELAYTYPAPTILTLSVALISRYGPDQILLTLLVLLMITS